VRALSRQRCGDAHSHEQVGEKKAAHTERTLGMTSTVPAHLASTQT
jgi:hypothetical protein